MSAEDQTDVQGVIAKAREAVNLFRDFARQHGMGFRQRDPLVMNIHAALDLAALSTSAPAPAGPSLTPDEWGVIHDGLNALADAGIGRKRIEQIVQLQNKLSRMEASIKAPAPAGPGTTETQPLPDRAGRPLPPPESDADVIAAVRGVIWEAMRGREIGGDRTLVGMVKRLIAERDEARENRRGEFELRMMAEAALRRMLADPYGCPFCDSGTLRGKKPHADDCGFALAQDYIAVTSAGRTTPEATPTHMKRDDSTPTGEQTEPMRACCAPAPDRSGRQCDKPKGHDGPHWTYGGNELTWQPAPTGEQTT